ncbi:MAG: hypothetical protein KJO38_05105, partial [Gammaproteobacteria bacterium]|nr:hypothetical protein [Gammaproteobacteria bacterium]
LALGNVNGATTTGTLTVDGDLTQLPGGVITVNVGGPLPDDADRLIVTGDLTAAGTVILTLVNDYAPPPGTTVEVIEAAGSFTGTLTGTITNPPPGISESFTVDEDGVATLAAAPAIVPAVPPAVAILLGLVLLAAGRRSLVEHVRRPN